ncbi:MAG TPA: YidC/Oxa1 family insertase periplasmic-domain containing protein, partial [Opitutales bacterium]|nr:YidC/Oxa1 family insertase periplasmic-domain containing protein [Opitutales bacterium]
AGAKLPALSLSIQQADGRFQEYEPAFGVVYQDADKILFKHVTPDGFEIYRGYSLPQDLNRLEPYVVSHETRFENKTDHSIDLKELFVNLGAVPPCSSDTAGEFLNVGYYNGDDAEFTAIAYFKGSSGFLGIGKKAPQSTFSQQVNPLVWASLKNQFFTSVFTPSKPGTRIFAEPIKMQDEQGHWEEGITARAGFDLGRMEIGDSALLNASYYVGPKEYVRLDGLGEHQDLVMQFGFFGVFSKVLLVILHAIHSVVPNYGLTIILITVLVKLLLWPLTAASTRSARKMSQLQAPIQVLKERYKDNPQKIQQETMKLFKEYKVNPAMGCLPIVVQIPIFIGLFWMLKSASELRFAHFLWIQDLSMPDTVAMLWGFPFNPLPLVMGVSMFVQMRLAPTATTDAFQKKMFQMMPFIFLVISYNFPSGLVLYWTVQNLLTILQQWISNRKPLPPLKLADTAPAGKKSGNKKKNKK